MLYLRHISVFQPMTSEPLHTDIAILGAGIGGFETFRTLAKLLKRHGINKTITIIDHNDYFTFTPLLHEVASGVVEPSHAALPLREIISGTPHRFFNASVKKVFPEKKLITTDRGDISYDYCVVGIGSGVNYYGLTGAEQFSFNVRTLPEATRLQEELVRKLENNEKNIDLVVVGGGFSGVEVAGQLAHLARHSLKKLYPQSSLTVSLVQNEATLVSTLPPRAQQLVTRRLKKMNVRIFLNSAVKEVTGTNIALADGKTIPSTMTIWCAGVKNVGEYILDPSYCDQGRFPVTQYLNQAKAPDLYGVGDIIRGQNIDSAILYPQLGEAAHAEGKYVARHIIASIRKKSVAPFYFKSKGMLMPIGERYGVAVIGPVVFGGLFAWWLRRTAYLLFMPGLLLKLKIVFDWTLRLLGFRDIMYVGKKQR